MKKFFYFSVALFSFLLVSCGEKEEENKLPDKILLSHKEYFDLVKSAAKAEINFEILSKAKKGEALELLILEGWRPSDCCSSKENNFDVNQNHFSGYGAKKYQRFPEGTYDTAPRSTLASEEDVEYFPNPPTEKQQFPFIENSPVFNNNNCCDFGELKNWKKQEEQSLGSNGSDNFSEKDFKKDTLIKKVLPWEIELGAGFSRGPLGALRFGNSRAEVGGLFLWDTKNKIANNLADVVLKPKDGNGFRYGVFYHNEISPQKWDIPSVETKTVLAGGVSTTISSTRKVEVEQWNIRKQTIGAVLGLQMQDEKFYASGDLMPGFLIQRKDEDDKDFFFNFRLSGGYFLNPKTLLGLNVGIVNDQFYPSLSMRFLPGNIEKTTENN